jgi:thioredoxin reductase (NADPH)
MFDLIIIGAGPSGLACAIDAKNAGLSVLVLEKGSLVDYIRRFPSNLTWFSTPELLEIGNIPFAISTVRPTRVDTLNYYQKVVRHHKISIRYYDAVEDVLRDDSGFHVTTVRGKTYRCSYIVVATGYFDHPNRLDVPGEMLPSVFHYYHEPFPYVDCEVVVVGGKNSAVEAALDLYRHGARVTLIHRGERLSEGVKYWILPDIENRLKAGEIRAIFGSTVREITATSVMVNTPDGIRELTNDFTFILIGFHPDAEQLTRFGVAINGETLGPSYDEKTFETHVPGLYVAGSVVAGKFNNKVFVENGRTHGATIVSSILSKLQNVD